MLIGDCHIKKQNQREIMGLLREDFNADLEFVKKIYTTQFSSKRILHTENA